MLLMSSILGFAQEEQTKQEGYYELSLEELMNIPINSASKKDETLFDAPLSSYTITKSDIEKSGATSIMEALRLAPGVIVREQTNGNYDIHIRGFDNILRTSETYSKTNLTTLVMINNRPVFNHNLGGTFWEALPIDVNDVERIEIVRGPSAPLFGPNAVTGVINIITKKVPEEKALVNANVQAGTLATTLANASVGKDFGKISLYVSGNYQHRERQDETYFFGTTNSYLTIAELSTLLPAGNQLFDQYPDPKLAVNKYGVNAAINFEASEKINFDLSLGTQQAETQKIFLSNIFNGGIPITNNETKSSYVNLAGQVHGLNFRTSYQPGYDNLALEAAPNQYDFNVFDFSAEYEIKLGELGNLVPGISYQNASLDDAAYTNKGLTFLNGEEKGIKTQAAFIRTDLKPTEAFRVIAALRMDKFSSPDDAYLAYELATTYKLNSKNLIRAAVTRSNSGSFVGNNFLNLNVPVPNGGGPGIDINYIRRGNQNMKLFTVDMIEVGFRSQLTNNLQLDIDVFSQKAKNLNALIVKGPDGTFTNGVPNFIQEFDDIQTTASQLGTTFSINYVPNEKIQIKPFVTIQKTEVQDVYSGYDLTSTFSDEDHENTPSVYGGYYVNINPIEKLNINLNGYFFTKQTQYDPHYSSTGGVGPESNIASKFIFNLKVGYKVSNDVNIFLNGRSVVGNDSREFFTGDRIGALILGGVSFDLN